MAVRVIPHSCSWTRLQSTDNDKGVGQGINLCPLCILSAPPALEARWRCFYKTTILCSSSPSCSGGQSSGTPETQKSESSLNPLSSPKLGEVSQRDGGVCTFLHVQIGTWHNINAYNSIILSRLPDSSRTGIPFYRTATKKQARGIERGLACLFLLCTSLLLVL